MKKILPVLTALALFAAACGGSNGAEGVASLEETVEPSAEKQPAETTDEAAILAFGECMRENGVPDFEDPVVNADGSVEFGGFAAGGPGSNGDFEPGTVRGAFQACGDLLEGLAFGPGSGDFDITEIEDTLVDFAACMRSEGIPFDDPDLSNFGLGGRGGGGEPGGGPFGGNFDFDDPEFQAAFETCQEAVGFGFGRGGPGGGRFGGGGDN
jgi:hypothetical protein